MVEIRVLICGDRNWQDSDLIREYLQQLKNNHEEVHRQLQDYPKAEGLIIIEGAAPGADSIARFEAEKLGLPVLSFPAEWKRYGNAAGPKRNAQMLKEGKPDCVLAFHDYIIKSKGTLGMIKIALEAGKYVKLVSHDYGITQRQFATLLVLQGQRCAMCNKLNRLVVDHNHKTGKTRGLICYKCNHSLGIIEDQNLMELGRNAGMAARSNH